MKIFFLHIPNQKETVCKLTENALQKKNLSLPFCEFHNQEKVIKMIISCVTNTLLKNYCKNKNDSLKSITSSNPNVTKNSKRKFSTLKN